jgi:hypothetical protein
MLLSLAGYFLQLEKISCLKDILPRIMSDVGNIHVSNPDIVERYLEGVRYPATKDELIDKAQDANAEDLLILALERLPDQEFENIDDVKQALFQL